MKKLFKNLPMVLMVMVLSVACGKENSSGGSGGQPKADDIINGGVGTAGQAYQSIEEVRERFNAKSMDVAEGTEMYHVGTYFGAQSSGSSGGIQVNVSGCLFGIIGNCDDDGTSGTNYIIQNMLNFIQQGRIYRVVGADASSVSGEKAVNVDQSANYVYEDLDMSRNSTFYTQMLAGSSNSAYPTARLAPAKVTLTNGQVVDAVAIQNQHGYFVVSTNFPVIANPIFAMTQSGSGALSNIGQSTVIKKIESQQMGIQYNFYGR